MGPRRPPGLGGSPPTWVEAAAGGVDRVTRANTHPALRPSPATPASRAASAPPRPVTRGRPDRHSLFPRSRAPPRRPNLSREARRGAAVGLGVHGAAPAPEPPPSGPRPARCARHGTPSRRPPPGSPRPARPRPRRRAAARARGEGRAVLPAPGVTGLQPAAPLPKHTAGLAGEPRRGGGGERGPGPGPAGAINQPAPAGRAALGAAGRAGPRGPRGPSCT